MSHCEHVVTAIRVRVRDDDGEPSLVGHQCVECLASVPARPGQHWLPRVEWPSSGMEDWFTVSERQTSLF